MNRTIFLELERLRNPSSGLGQFCLNLGKEISRLATSDLELRYFLPEKSKNAFGESGKYVVQSPWHKLIPPVHSRTDVWHCMHQQSKYLPSSSSTRLILTIHDLNFLQKYSGIKQRLHLRALQKRVDRASVITVISRYTEQMVRRHLDLRGKPVHIIYNGVPVIAADEALKPAYVPARKFLLAVGIVSEKKNFHTLLPMVEKLDEYALVIAGDHHTPYGKEIKGIADKMKLHDRLVMAGPANRNELAWLYQNCEALVFPSLAEGFGLPVIEAMSFGKPVVLSTYTSLPEIGGEMAYYFHDFNPNEMAGVVRKAIQDSASDPDFSEKRKAHASKFSWETAAQQYLELYRTV